MSEISDHLKFDRNRFFIDIAVLFFPTLVFWFWLIGPISFVTGLLLLGSITSFCLTFATRLHFILRILFFLAFLIINLPLVFFFIDSALRQFI